jgi:hypothetical protein
MRIDLDGWGITYSRAYGSGSPGSLTATGDDFDTMNHRVYGSIIVS